MKWKIIPSFNKYEASNLGEIRNGKTKRVLKPDIFKNRCKYRLKDSSGVMKKTSTHRLVAEAFLGDIDAYEVDHINRNPRDNKVENLRLVNRRVNMENMNWFDKRKERIQKVIRLHQSGLSVEEIARTIKKAY